MGPNPILNIVFIFKRSLDTETNMSQGEGHVKMKAEPG